MRRATDALIRDWAESMPDLTWKTRHTRLVGLSSFLTGITPDAPQTPLRDLCREAEWYGYRLARERKIGRIAPTDQIVRAAVSYLSDVKGTTFVDAMRYRDGLMVASLALLTLRITNFRDLKIGRSFQERSGGYDILLSGSETKNHRPLDKEFPTQLIPAMARCLCMYRPILLEKSKDRHDFLWVNDWGNRYSHSSLGARISRLTLKMLGVAISAHLFGDAAATTITRAVPSKSRAIAGVLGHASLRTADRYYNQSKCLDASRSFKPLIEELYDDATDPHAGRRRRARNAT